MQVSFFGPSMLLRSVLAAKGWKPWAEHGRARLQVSEDGAILVRADGHVAWRCTDLPGAAHAPLPGQSEHCHLPVPVSQAVISLQQALASILDMDDMDCRS